MPDYTNDYDYEEEQRHKEIQFDSWQSIDGYLNDAKEKIEGIYVDTEETVDADEARLVDVDRLALKEEEDYINKNLPDGHYIDGNDVAAIHRKCEKQLDGLGKELVKAKSQGDLAKIAEVEKDINKLKKSRDAELQKLCDEAPRYNRAAVKSMMAQQLKAADAGRPGSEIKIYRQEKDHDGLMVTTYGRNRVGRFNQMLREREKKAKNLKGQKAQHQKDKLGYSTKEFLRGDAESMFKGSVAMSLHAALFLLNKLAQAGNMAAHHALHQYAFNKLTMDDAEAMQKAVDDMQKSVIETGKEGERSWNGTFAAMDFEDPDLPPFEAMEKSVTPDAEHDVVAVNMSYIAPDGTMMQGDVYLGTEDNVRQYFEGMGDMDVDAEVAENAAKVEALGIENLMVEDVQNAYDASLGKESGVPEKAEDYSYEEEYEDDPEEEEKSETVGHEAVTPVLAPRDIDVENLLNGGDGHPHHDEGESKKEPKKEKSIEPLTAEEVKNLKPLGGSIEAAAAVEMYRRSMTEFKRGLESIKSYDDVKDYVGKGKGAELMEDASKYAKEALSMVDDANAVAVWDAVRDFNSQNLVGKGILDQEGALDTAKANAYEYCYRSMDYATADALTRMGDSESKTAKYKEWLSDGMKKNPMAPNQPVIPLAEDDLDQLLAEDEGQDTWFESWADSAKSSRDDEKMDLDSEDYLGI